MNILMLEIAAHLKMVSEGLIAPDQAKREAGELLEKVGQATAGDTRDLALSFEEGRDLLLTLWDARDTPEYQAAPEFTA